MRLALLNKWLSLRMCVCVGETVHSVHLCLHMRVFKWVPVMITHQSEGFAFFFFWFIFLSKAQDGEMESGREIKECDRSHRHRRARCELKVEEEIEGPQRETAPFRLKCESQQGTSSSWSVWHLCVCVWLWDLQLVCGPYSLTPYLIHKWQVF